MSILSRFRERDLEYREVEEGKKTSCLIPIPVDQMRVDVICRCPSPVVINAVTEEGQTMLLESGTNVRWSGRIAGLTAVEIVAERGFWYSCQKSRLFEFNDGVPLKVELVQTEGDVLRMMIEERLKQYRIATEMSREMTEEEWEAAVLDIASGDLEFENEPDMFGIGYTERLREFEERRAEQEREAAAEAADTLPAGSSSGADTLPAAGSNSSST